MSVHERVRLADLGRPPPLAVERWLNADEPITLEAQRGKVVLLHAFQMLCPGCVLHAIPQAQRVARTPYDDLVVLGLHSVFELHAAMAPVALEAFVHEFRLDFPIGIDAHRDGDPLPLTMRAYALQGTPTTLLIDRAGRLRMHRFGAIDDLELGIALGMLLAE